MNKTTAELENDIEDWSVRIEKANAELARRAEVEKAWKAGKRVEWRPWRERETFDPKWQDVLSINGGPLCWDFNDYRIAADRHGPPAELFVNLDAISVSGTACGWLVGYGTREDAAKALPGTPADRIVRYTREAEARPDGSLLQVGDLVRIAGDNKPAQRIVRSDFPIFELQDGQKVFGRHLVLDADCEREDYKRFLGKH
jgi:hypothetical protein